jgi:hypothetical protein
MTFDERVQALGSLGLTPRQTRFLVTVALHSGYCLRRQYTAFAGVRYGKNVRAFFDGLVGCGVARRLSYRADRGHVYHVHARSVYRAIGQDDNRNRRHTSPALMARKVMLLDFVLSEPDVSWFATEEDKVALFTTRLDVPPLALPCRIYEAASENGRTTRYFVHKLPVYVAREPGVVHFVYLAMESTADGLQQFLVDHASLFNHLPRWSVVCLRPGHLGLLPGCEQAFEQFLRGRLDVPRRGGEALAQYFTVRHSIEREQLAQLSVADIYEFRAAKRRFSAAALERLYSDWLVSGNDVADRLRTAAPRTHGQLVIRTLPHPYEQFGGMAGVA